MNKIIYEVYKNIKILFRNWSSLALIVLAPLFLILLVGYSFSGETLHDVNIGLVTEAGADVSELIGNLSSFAKVISYEKIDDCILSMALEKTHLCLEMKGTFKTEKDEMPTGEVAFYYDNRRKTSSLLILSEIKGYFGLTSERISLISTTKIIDNIQNLLIFLNDRIEDIDQVKYEAEKIKQDLILRRVELINMNESFTPRYNLIKNLQANMHSYTDAINNNTKQMTISVYAILAATSEIKSLMNKSMPKNLSIAISNLESAVNKWQNTSSQTTNNMNSFIKEVDSTVIELDNINTYLNNEIYRTDETISLIDSSLIKITNISIEAKEKMSDLSKIDPSLASKLIRPITQSFTTLINNVSNVQLAFPILLTTVIVFITLLFSNIISLSELRDKAYIRNILAPVNDLVYTSGLILTNFLIISLQVTVLLFVAEIKFGLNIVSHLSSLIPVMILLVLMFTFLGMLIAYMSKSTETSILLTTFIALGFFMFSDSLNALEIMPKIAYQIASFNPVVLVNSMFREIIFSDIALSQISSELMVLGFYTIAMGSILVIISKKKNSERI